MGTLQKAIEVAVAAHAGQLDKSGQPYVLHPLHLMLQMEDEVGMITAVLHDVVEDSDVTMADLREMGFDEAVLAALALLTHDKEALSYEAYIDLVATNALARRVKLADLQHNMDVRRLPHPLTAKAHARLDRYHRAYSLLQVGG